MTKRQKLDLLLALSVYADSIDCFNAVAKQITEAVDELRDWREPRQDTIEYIVRMSERLGNVAIKKNHDYRVARDWLAEYMKVSTARANLILENGPGPVIALLDDDL